MHPGVTLVRYLAIGRYDNVNTSSSALTIDDEHASSGNSGWTLDGRESAQSCLFTGDCCGLIGIRMTDSSCVPLRSSYDSGLSIAIVVRRRQWLEMMELFIAFSALIVHGRRCTPRGHDGVARYNVTYTAELCSSSNSI